MDHPSESETAHLSLEAYLEQVRACRICADVLPRGPRPIVEASAQARILIVGQAPGTRVHETGIPWNDPSGDRLRAWLDVSREVFYDTRRFAIVPMGYCYPGRGKSGDLPPRKECAEHWLEGILTRLPALRLRLLVGQYAQAHFLGKRRQRNLTETVRAYASYGEEEVPLPHPSPRNTLWLRRNPWFEAEVVPNLRQRVGVVLRDRPPASGAACVGKRRDLL